MLAVAVGKKVAQFFLFGFQIFKSVFGGRDFARHTLGHLNPRIFKRGDLVRVIRKQTNPPNIQCLQDLDRHQKLALVGLEPKALVSFHRVQSTVLERLGLELGHQANAPAFLLFIDQHARSLTGDPRE